MHFSKFFLLSNAPFLHLLMLPCSTAMDPKLFKFVYLPVPPYVLESGSSGRNKDMP